MPKRKGNIYDSMWDWDNLRYAETVTVRRKMKHNRGLKMHIAHRMANMVEIQQQMMTRTMRTSRYITEQRKSGSDKMRSISKLHFHPNHIQQQSLVLAGENRADKSFIRHSYASRKGYGQIKAATQVRDWIKKDPDGTRWYAQLDIRKYYQNIPHSLVVAEMCRIFKDKEYVDAFVEPLRSFAPDGVGIPLGARVSQLSGNIALNGVDHYAKETLRIHYYLRYLDDILIMGKTKGEVKRYAKQLVARIESLGFQLHPMVVAPLACGLDILGFVYYEKGRMYWRRRNKARWLRHRSHTSNARRMRELDASAWGMLKHGGKSCHELYKKNAMPGVGLKDLGIQRKPSTDSNGVRIIDVRQMSMRMVVDDIVTITDWVFGVKTVHGPGRLALLVTLSNGMKGKIITNSIGIKAMVKALEERDVTMFSTRIRQTGNNYDMVDEETEILAIGGKEVSLVDGRVIIKRII